MKSITILSALFVFAIGLLPAAARAEVKSGAWTLSPMLGGIVMEGDQIVGDDIAYSVGLGYNFTSAFSVEATLAGANLEEDGTGDYANLLTLRMDALYHFMTNGPLVPYLALGAGLYNLEGDDDFMAAYGLGLLYFIGENIAVRGDVRHLIAKDDPDHNLLYTVGLKFQFGGPADGAVPDR